MDDFGLTPNELEAARSWIQQHAKEHVVKYMGAIGGRWTYSFTPTSIGVMKAVRCNSCHAEANITDFDHF